MASRFQFEDLGQSESEVVQTEAPEFAPLYIRDGGETQEFAELSFRNLRGGTNQGQKPPSEKAKTASPATGKVKAATPRAASRPERQPSPLEKAELERLKDEAIKAGISQGYAQGYQEGLQTGKREGSAALLEQAESLKALLDSLKEAERELFDAVKGDVLAIVRRLPEQILHRELKTDPEVIVTIVNNLMEELPRQRRLEIHVNPEDLELLKNSKLDSRTDLHGELHLEARPKLSRGSVHLITDGGHIDAAISTQLERLNTCAESWIEGEEDSSDSGSK